MQYSEIDGWFDFDRLYHNAVATAADGAHFVEVGAWLGRSTAFMGERIAASGKRIKFDAVDTWTGGTDAPVNALLRAELPKYNGHLYDMFLQNMEACGVKEFITPVRADSAEAAERYADGSLDFVFIDGDHSAPIVARDLAAYWPKVKPGGVMAGHDIGENDVEASLRVFCQSNGLSYYREGASWVMEKTQPRGGRILLGMPHSGRISPNTALSAMMHPSHTPDTHVEVMTHQTSLLAAGFNYLWTQALERDFDYFAMLHADIQPDWNWMDVLLGELQRTGADLVSVVVPIKDERGLTSTAIGHPTIWWSPLRRLTMREVMGLPPTFTAEDAGYPGHAMLVNTGCWMANLRNPKWRETDADGRLKVYFNIKDRIAKTDSGYVCQTQPEDWGFSSLMFQNGLKAVATRKVQLGHVSDFPWPNYAAFGKWEHDDATAPHWNKQAQPA
ncbi:MAG: class I SAM-dependent methyltransferase [Phycisphaerae bacterium]|nr:class I SAM-dependent methyltransferase [Phycisphaerae bacterium]